MHSAHAILRPPRLLMIVLVLSLLASAALGAETTVQVVDLHHRPAKQIIPIIQPFLDKGDVVRANGFQLIIRTSPARLAEIQRILARIDRAPRRLLITVRHTNASTNDARGAGANVRVGPDQTRTRARIYSTQRRDDAAASQQIQTLEGSRAFIRTGQLVPLGERSVITSNNGTSVQDSVHYQQISSGFYVVPRLNGAEVTLTIMPQRAALSRNDGGRVEVQQADTTVRGRLGTWITVGGTVAQSGHSSGAITYQTEDRSEQQGTIQVKVDEIK